MLAKSSSSALPSDVLSASCFCSSSMCLEDFVDEEKKTTSCCTTIFKAVNVFDAIAWNNDWMWFVKSGFLKANIIHSSPTRNTFKTRTSMWWSGSAIERFCGPQTASKDQRVELQRESLPVSQAWLLGRAAPFLVSNWSHLSIMTQLHSQVNNNNSSSSSNNNNNNNSNMKNSNMKNVLAVDLLVALKNDFEDRCRIKFTLFDIFLCDHTELQKLDIRFIFLAAMWFWPGNAWISNPSALLYPLTPWPGGFSWPSFHHLHVLQVKHVLHTCGNRSSHLESKGRWLGIWVMLGSSCFICFTLPELFDVPKESTSLDYA